MKVLFALITLLAIGSCVRLTAQSRVEPDSLLNRLTGTWVLKGTIAGRETTHDVSAKRVLNGQYIQLTEVSREKDPTGTPAYDAIVYFCWQQPKQKFYCLWLDNTSNEGISNHVTGEAPLNGNTIGWIFTYGDVTRFYNTFLYDPLTDSWQWKMDGEEKGKLKPFARLYLTRGR